MAGQGQGISVPISLQISNLQSIVNMLQSKLSNLKVGTAGFKSLQTIISTIQKDIDKLAIQTDKPFVSANQFTAADRAVNKLEEDLDKVQITVSRIKFSDLELDPSQAAELKAFETQIESIKNSLKTVKETAKQAFLDSDVGKGWAHDHAEATTQTLSQLTAAITKEVNTQRQQLESAEKAVTDYQQAIQVSKNINNFMSKRSGHQLSEATMGKELFDKVFKTDEQGQVLKFQNGGKTLLQQWLQQQFNLDSATVQSLTEGAGQAVVKAFAEIGGKVEAALKAQKIKLQNAATEQKTATNNGSTLEAAVKEKAEKLNQTEAVQAQLVASNTSVSASEAQLRTELEQTKAQLAEYKERLAQAVRTNPDWAESNKQASAALQQLRDTLSQTNGQFLQQQRVMSSFNSMKMAVVNFMGFNQVLNITRKAVREAINHIKELDTVMNGIAIVTDMSTGDLWTQIDQYSKMAQAYGVSITGAYEVSQIYYQQGLETADVMTLTNETLKLAKISGLDYATTTDYMTTAIRGFKMEMSEASTVVDVYSNLAAHTAVSQEELAVAMSKTASSMEGVGATFEEASAMIGTMVAVTRESATNIGSAMKSIASRYGELTKDPTKLVDEEGEAMAFNKVDAALQSVGISMRTVDGQFREFTDVIVELGEKWEQLDSTQQRYIATQFAGNRQQSRFLALVSNVDLLKSNLDVAMNSEDTGTLQALKALDSIESKIEQVKVAYQQFYTTIGAESIWKGLLDSTKNVINTLNGLPKLFGKIPIGAIAAISSIISLIKNLGMDLLNTFAQTFGQSVLQGALQAQGQAAEGAHSLIGIVLSTIKSKKGEFIAAGQEGAKAYSQGIQQGSKTLTPDQLTGNKKIYYDNFNNTNAILNSTATNPLAQAQDIGAYTNIVSQLYEMGLISKQTMESMCQDTANYKTHLQELQAPIEEAKRKLLEIGDAAEQSGGKFKNFLSNHKNLSQGLQSFGSALNMIAMTFNTTAEGGKTWSGVLQGMAAAATLAGVAVKVLDQGLKSMPWMALASGVLMAINAISTLFVTPEERLEELENKAEELNNKAKEEKANYRILDSSIKKLDELKEKRYESAEAAEEYQTAVDELADKFPEMIAGFDEAGNVIIDTTNAEAALSSAREKSAVATYKAVQAELEAKKQNQRNLTSKIRGKLQEASNNYVVSEPQTTLNSDKINNLIGEESEYFRNNRFNLSREDILDYFSYNNDQANELLSKYYDELKETWNLDKLNSDLQNHLFSNNEEDIEIKEALEQLFDVPITLDEQITAIQEEAAFLSGADLTKPENIDRIGKLNDRIRDFNQTNPGMLPEELIKPDGILDQLMNLMAEYNSTTDTLTSLSRQEISLWQQVQAAKNNAWEHVFKSDALVSIATNYLDILANGEDWDTFITNEDNLNQVEEFEDKLADLYERLSLDPEKLQQFEQMSNDSINYSAQDLLNYFNITDPILIDAINKKYKKTIDLIQDSLKQNLATSLKIKDSDLEVKYENKQLSDFYTQYYDAIQKVTTSTERAYLTNILDSYQNLISQGYTNKANAVGDAALNIFNEIINVDNPILQKQLWNLVNETGLTTLEGIEKIKNTIKNDNNLNNAVNIDTYLDTLYNNIIPNINLEIQTAISDLLENWENTSKELSSALSSGVSLKEADALITKAKSLGLKDFSLNNFQLVGDKLVLVGESWEDYYNKLTESVTSSITAWQTRIDQANKALSAISNYGQSSIPTNILQDYKAALEAIGFTDWNNYEYVTQWGTLTKEGKQHIQDLINNTTEELTEYSRATAIATRQLLTAHETSQGIYKLVINEIETNLSEDLDKLKIIAKGGTLGGNAINERAIKDSINNVYNTFISDVLSKGFENIRIEDYEGLVNAKDIQLKNISYEQFVKDYIDYTGASIEEANNLLVQAIEKDQAKTSSSLLKDIQFRSPDLLVASLDALKNLASAYGKNLGDLLTNAQQEGENYILSISTLIEQGLDITQIDGFSDQVKDGVAEFFSKIVSLLENGLKGSLSSVDATNLKKYASSIGFNGELDFTETVDGLKLADQSAIQLQAHIASVNRIAGQTSFKVLNESLQETNEYYKTVSANMARIAELQEIIAKADDTVSKARLKEYQQELKVAKDIFDTNKKRLDELKIILYGKFGARLRLEED